MATNWLRDLDRADFAKRCPLVSYDREKRPLERIFRKVQSDGILLPVLFVFSKPHYQLTAAFIFHTDYDISQIGRNTRASRVANRRPGRGQLANSHGAEPPGCYSITAKNDVIRREI